MSHFHPVVAEDEGVEVLEVADLRGERPQPVPAQVEHPQSLKAADARRHLLQPVAAHEEVAQRRHLQHLRRDARQPVPRHVQVAQLGERRQALGQVGVTDGVVAQEQLRQVDHGGQALRQRADQVVAQVEDAKLGEGGHYQGRARRQPVVVQQKLLDLGGGGLRIE